MQRLLKAEERGLMEEQEMRDGLVAGGERGARSQFLEMK
jgi:hypothetical protein